MITALVDVDSEKAVRPQSRAVFFAEYDIIFRQSAGGWICSMKLGGGLVAALKRRVVWRI